VVAVCRSETGAQRAIGAGADGAVVLRPDDQRSGLAGRLVNLGGAAFDRAEFSSATLRGRSIDILGYTNNAISAEQRADALTQVLTLAARGEVSVEYQVFPLADCAQAWASAGSSGYRVVVAID
jgi:NADPH:quinone reductase-like Zn-dependent oxidoreductase